MRVLDSSESIEDTLFQMISEGQIKAKIDSKEQMISFIDTASQGHSEEARETEYLEIVEELEKQSQRIIELMKKVENADTNIQSTNQYIRKTLFGKDIGGAKEDSSGDMMMR